MLSVKLVRSLVLGETLINPPCLPHHHHHHHHHVHDDHHGHTHTHHHDEYDADDDDNDAHLKRTTTQPQKTHKSKPPKFKRKMPLLLFTPTKELISSTFRLAIIARDIGMDYYPSHSLSHLLFSWPSSSSSSLSLPSSSLPSSSYSPLSTLSSNNRPSVSSTTTTTSSSSSSSSTAATCSSLWGGTIPNDAVPLPFPSLSTSSSISLLRYFVSLSKGLFKLVFVDGDANSRFNCNYYANCNYGGINNHGFDPPVGSVKLVSRVSGKEVNSMEEFSRVLAGNGWAFFRSHEVKKNKVESEKLDAVFMFRKQDSNRVRVRVRDKKLMNGGGGGGGGDGGGECRVRELRLPALDFKRGVPLRILQYILLMTDDVFYLA